jgi:hypothetical protein
MNFEGLQLEETGQGVASITDCYTDLQFSKDCLLHVGLMHTGVKPLMHHFAIFKPVYSTTKYLAFDVRQLFSLESSEIPLKGLERLAFITELLEERFSSDEELFLAIATSKMTPLAI